MRDGMGTACRLYKRQEMKKKYQYIYKNNCKKGKISHGTFKYRNIKMGLKVYGVMYWIPLTQDSK